MRRHRVLRLALVVCALAFSQTGWTRTALAACDDEEYTWNDDDWANYCIQANYFTDTSICNSEEWDAAKENIDWVLFEDKSATDTFLAGLSELGQCSKTDNAGMDAYHALLHAQKHNPSAQCSIALCRQEFTAWNGYYNALNKAGKMPKPASQWSPICGSPENCKAFYEAIRKLRGEGE